jgi:peroxiredoxin
MLSIKHFPFLLLAMVWVSCSPKQNSEATKPLPRLDPLSVPLYPATAKAKAKDFTVILVSGEEFTLSEQRGKVVLLNIWATWCAPCHVETPEFVELYAEYRDDGLQILGVSIDKQGEAVVKPFMEKYEVNYPVVIDDGTIMDKYGPTMGIPTTYIIGKDGNLKYFAVGALTKKELEPRLKKLLGGGTNSP